MTGMNAQQLPGATVSFLFTDIEQSTALGQQHPDAMKNMLARHHEILRNATKANGGHVFQIIGDAFCAAFRTAPDAHIRAGARSPAPTE